jgi:hypothetical protein
MSCLLPQFATGSLRPTPFYLALVVTRSRSPGTLYTLTAKLVKDSVFLGRIQFPKEWLTLSSNQDKATER